MNASLHTPLHAPLHAVLSLVCAAALVACSTDSGLRPHSQQQQDLAQEVVQKALPAAGLRIHAQTPGTPEATEALNTAKPVARRAGKAWYGARMVDVQSDEVLPPLFHESRSFQFDDRSGGGRVPIAVVAERITRMTGLPVRIKADVYSPVLGAGSGAGSTAGARTGAGSTLSNPRGIAILGAQGTPVATVPPVASATYIPAIVPGAPLAGAAGSLSGQEGDLGSPGVQTSAPGPMYRQPITDVASVDMRWSGTLAGFLDQLTARLNLSWSYRDGTVVIERYVTETFELAAFAGSQEYKMALASGNSGGSGGSVGGSSAGSTGSSSSNLDLNESGKVQVLHSLKAAIESMVRDGGGQVVLNEGSGRFFVTATRDVMARVRSVVKAEDASLQRQAHIQIDIYSVVQSEANEAGANWNILFQNLAQLWGANIKSPTSLTSSSAGNIGVSILSSGSSATAQRFGNSQAVLNLLSQVGNSAQHRPVSMIALNRQWARKTNLRTDGYVSETTPSTASAAGSGSPGLKTTSITTGDKFMVQPAILDNGSIVLKFGVSLTELLDMLQVSAGSGNTLQTVQTPITSGTDDQTTVRLMPGEAMVVTGLSRRLAAQDRRSLTENSPWLLGGSRASSNKREDFVIVVRATPI